jgi:putative ATP-binding cassette transporter
MEAFENFKRLLFWELNLNGLTNAYEFIPFILPALVVAPAVFSGDVEVGKVSEAQGAFIRVFFSLNVIVARFQSLTAFGAGIDRLYEFAESLGHVETLAETQEVAESQSEEQPESLESEEAAIAPSHSVILQEISPQLSLQRLTLQTPNYQRTLIESLTLELEKDSSLLVVGPSGCGKSSLLRAIAGLWNSGEGTIQRPELDHLLFLPQQPYMILGNLRQQLIYPYSDSDLDDEQLQTVLKDVNLPDLAERFGGFDAEEEWGDVLSLGEQQRLSFARVLLHQPTYAILDEATSALDQGNEENLYKALEKTSTTYLSVGHRTSLEAHHRWLLRLAEDHTWQLQPLNS